MTLSSSSSTRARIGSRGPPVSMITAWQTGLFVSGDTIGRDRQFGIFELMLGAPVGYRSVLLGRIAVATTFAFAPFLLGFTAVLAAYGTDVISVERPAMAALVMAASWFAMLGALTMMSPVSVLSGRSVAITNGLSYPLFLLAGIVVPVEFLPGWIQPVSRVLFMRWQAEGLRNAATGDGSLTPSFIGLAATGAVMLVIGFALIDIVVRRMRLSGQVVAA